MPAMPRVSDKTKDIAFNIIGTPGNLKKKNGGKRSKIRRRLNQEEARRVR